jgi:CHAT domain-containing protein
MKPALGFLQQLAGLEQSDAIAYLFRHPVLLDAATQQALMGDVVKHPELAHAFAFVGYVRQELEAKNVAYPIGDGPLETIKAQQDRGEIDEDDAMKRVRHTDFLETLSPLYLEYIATAGRKMLFAGQWKDSLVLLTLANAVADEVRKKSEWQHAAASVELEYVQTVTFALLTIPDDRMLKQAAEVAQKVIDYARKAKKRPILAEAHRRLAVLHLDPFTANRTSADFPSADQAWRYRIVDHLGPMEYATHQKEVVLPKTLDALKIAEKHLRIAIDLTEGHLRARNLKALAQALIFQRVVGESITDDAILKIIDEALPKIDRSENEVDYVQLVAWKKTLGGGTASDFDEEFKPIAELIDELGPGEAMQHVITTTVATNDYEAALRQLEDARDLFMTWGDDKFRSQRWIAMQQAAASTMRSAIASPKDFASLEKSVRRGAPEEMLPWRLYFLSLAAGNWNEEKRGIEIVDEIAAIDPDFAARNGDVLAFARGNAWIGEGSNQVQAGDPAAAIEAYGNALPPLVSIRQVHTAADVLRRIHDLLSKHADDEHVPIAVVIALMGSAMRLEAGDEQITSLLHRIYRDTFSAMTRTRMQADAIIFLLEMAKGMRFASAFRGGFDRNAVAALGADDRVASIFQLEKSVSAQARVSVDAHDEMYEYLLASYVAREEQQAGSTDRERFENLQLAFDHDLSHAVLSSVSKQDVYVTAEDIQEALDERSIVLVCYLGSTPDGKLALFVFAITRDDIRINATTHPFPEATLQMEKEGRSFRMHPIGLLTSQLRRNVMESPDYLVQSDAAATLEKDVHGIFGHIAEFLDELRGRGYDRMYIAPHGPLHYYPFHLIGKPGEPLAQHWTISYLPSLQLLMPSSSTAADGHATVVAVGIGFDDDITKHLGDPLSSREEANEIAKIFGTKPLLDADATQDRVVTAMQTARYVHLSTHGQHNVTAPAFQFVQLYPQGNDDGRLFAYEVAALDLSGVELVTFSACETALGRFDEADNLRGLPASLLLAGVTTIVGTLWPVDDVTSLHFFTTLYKHLSQSNDVPDAFRKAQVATRSDFPDYRDWGAFYLVAGLPRPA